MSVESNVLHNTAEMEIGKCVFNALLYRTYIISLSHLFLEQHNYFNYVWTKDISFCMITL